MSKFQEHFDTLLEKKTQKSIPLLSELVVVMFEQILDICGNICKS